MVASKAVTTLGILLKAMLRYQPGGLGERGAILQALENPTESSTIPMAITQLRKWIRWKRRAFEMGVSIPDSSILMQGLSRLMKKLVTSYPDLNFRLSLVRHALLVDTVPTLESVTKYSEHLSAELEQLGQHAKRKEAPEVQPQVKKLEETNSTEERQQRPKGKPQEDFESRRKPCRFFLSEAGSKRGRNCSFGHLLDGEKRCWTCGSRGHVSTSCPTTEEGKPRAAKMKTTGEDKDTKSTSSPEKAEVQSEGVESAGEDSMKVLIANRMLQSLQQSEPKEKTITPKVQDDKMAQLQRQLDELKKAALRPFRFQGLGAQRSMA